MAEIGLVPFARVALQISRDAVPAYRTKFSKRQFSQPQLLAILCLMRYEDWTFRETEVRLAEHQELRVALELMNVPDHTTLYRFMRRLSAEVLDAGLRAALKHVPGPAASVKVSVAVDATGLASGAISTFFVKRVKDRGNGFEWRHWLKWLLVVDVDRRAIVAQRAHRGPYNDCATLRPLVDAAQQVLPIQCVLADAEFDSERNHQHIRQQLKAQSIIPPKRGKSSLHLQGIRAHMRKRFPRRKYGQRSLIESVFSTIERKLSARAPGHSIATQQLQALLLGLAYNIYRVQPPTQIRGHF
jgi:hypothetical protein